MLQDVEVLSIGRYVVFYSKVKYLGYLRNLKPSLIVGWDLLSVIFFEKYLNESENFGIYPMLLKRYSFSEDYLSDLCLIHKVTVLLPKNYVRLL